MYIYIYPSHVNFFPFDCFGRDFAWKKGKELIFISSILSSLEANFSKLNQCTSTLVLFVGHKVKNCWLNKIFSHLFLPILAGQVSACGAHLVAF